MNGNADVESAKALVAPSTKPKIVEAGSTLPAKQKRGSSLRQVVAALFANFGTINTGMAFGFSAVAIPQLLSGTDSPFKIDMEQSSWVASLSAMTTPIGCILSGYLMDALGRKRILIVTQIPMIIGWLVIAFANKVELIYVGRMMVGLGSGMVGAPARVYTAEATQPHLRGFLTAIASVGVSLGVTLEYALGAAFSWPTLSLLNSLVPMAALLGALLLPESPSWLASAGKRDACKTALTRLRGKTCDVESEVAALVAFNEKNTIHKPSMSETVHALVQPSAIKPFIILALYFLIYQFSGVNPVTFYAVEVFEDSGADVNKYLLTVILGLVRLFFTILGCILMRKCGRRPLTFVSSVGCGLTMISLGSYMAVGQGWASEGIAPKATWIPVMSIMGFIAVSTIGYLVVPWVMIGEVYPTQVRGIVGGMTTCVGHFCVFIVVKTFPELQKYISKHGTFWLYGGISLAGTLFFYFFLPETKGRSLQEIEDYFSGRLDTLKKPKPPKDNNNRPILLKPSKGENLP